MNIIEKKINNLKVFFIPQKGAPSNSAQFWFRAGSSLENKSNQGIAHFLEHMFFKGTKKRPGAKIAHEVESFGGDINAFTSFDYTCYYINSPKPKLSKTIEILMDMVSNPLFLEKELIPERGVVFEEYRRSIDNPHHYNFHQIQKNTFSPGYSHPILGREDTIKNFTRKQLVEFRKKYYNTSNSALLISGDFNSTTNFEKIIKKFSIPKGPKTKYKKFSLNKSPNSIHIHNKDIVQNSLTLIIPAPEYDSEQAINEDLAINCLAYGETSYLHQKLVKQSSVATSTSGSTMFMNKGGAHFLKVVYPKENHKEVLKELAALIEEIKTNKFKSKDIEKIKNQYIASKIYERENLESLTFSYGHGFAQNENLHSEHEFIDRIKNSKNSSINDAIEKIFSKNISIHLQIPEKEKSSTYKSSLTKLKKQLTKKSKESKKDLKTIKSKFDKNVELLEIKKGIKFLYRYNSATPTFVMHSYIKGGISAENEKDCGKHYILAKLLNYGHHEKSYRELKEDLANKSASLSGFSGKNAYGLTMHGLSSDFDSLTNDFFHSLMKPTVKEEFVELEKEMIQRYLKNILKDPVKQCFKSFQKHIFKNSSYALDITGNSETLPRFSSDFLKDLHSQNLKGNEILITYCGNHKIDQVLEKIHSHLNLENRSVKKHLNFNNKYTQKTSHLEFDREQTQIFIGYPGLSLHDKDDIYLKILSTFLSGQSSELFVEVRDRQGLCYATQPVHHTALQAGYWGIYIGSGADKVDKAIEAIRKILNRLQKSGLSKTEVKRLKDTISGQKQMQLQSNEDFANFYSIPTLHGLSLDFENINITRIKKLDHLKINKFLKKFLNQDPTIITAGPSKK